MYLAKGRNLSLPRPRKTNDNAIRKKINKRGKWVLQKKATRREITHRIAHTISYLASGGRRSRFIFRARVSVGATVKRTVSHINVTPIGCGQETMGGDDGTGIS